MLCVGAEWNGLEDSEKQEYYEKAAEQRLKYIKFSITEN